MPIVTKPFDHPLSGGQDNGNADHRGADGTFDALVNFRPEDGKLVQPPKLGLFDTISDLGPGLSPITMMEMYSASNYLLTTQKEPRLWDTSLAVDEQVPYIHQTVSPTTAGETKQMLLYELNTTDFDVQYSSYFVVEVVTAGTSDSDPAEIKWNKNGGSWSADTDLVNGMTIGTNLKLAATETWGFTPGDSWTWSWIVWPTDTSKVHFPRVSFRDDIYFSGPEDRVMRFREYGTDDWTIAQVGYRNVCGKFVKVFHNHLFVGQFYQAGTAIEAVATDDSKYTIGWSHLNDPDQFYATDVNEADEYLLPYAGLADLRFLGITGCEQFGEYMYTYTPDQIFVTAYLGLPLVMRTVNVTDAVGCCGTNALVNTPYGHFFMGRGDFFFFNPTEGLPQSIGRPIREAFFGEVDYDLGAFASEVFGYYDHDRKEVAWTYTNTSSQAKQVIYCIEKRLWFFREMPAVYCSAPAALDLTQRFYGMGVGKIAVDDLDGTYDTYQPELPASAHVKPAATKHTMVYDTFTGNKVLQHTFLDASWTACDGIQVSASAKDYVSQTPSYTAAADLWSPTVVEKRVTHRLKGRAFKTKILATGTTPNHVEVQRWAELVEGQGDPTT